MVKDLRRYLLIVAVLILILGFVTKGFAVAPTVAEMIGTGENLDYIANYIISHASEFAPYTVDVAKVFLGLSAGGVVSGGATGAQAISVWAKVAAGTAYGLVVSLSIYDIVKAYQLISALVELNDIKRSIAEVRYVQRYDRIGVISMASVGNYQEYYVRCYSKPSDTFHINNGVVYEFIFVDPQYWDGSDFYLIEYPGYFLARYYNDGSKDVSALLGFMNYNVPYGEPSDEFVDFVTTTGILEKAEQGALSFSYSSQPGYVIWDFESPGLYKVDPFDQPDISDPLFAETQKIGVITTPEGEPLGSALSPEEWAMISSLSDIAPYVNFEGMEYGAYRTLASYDVPVPEEMVDTSRIVYGSGSGYGNVDPETIQQIQQQLQTLTQQVQSILSQMQQVHTIPELQQQVSELQQTQVEISELVQTLSQTVQQVQTQTEENTTTLQILQQQYETSIQLMKSTQSALEKVNQLQSQVETLTEQLNGVMTENGVIVENLNTVQAALGTIQEEFPELREEVQSTSETLQQLQTQTETNTETLQQLETQIQTLSETIQNIWVNVDLSPVIQAINEVAMKVDALTEEVQSLDEYLHEGFFEKLAEKVKEILKEMFVPDPEQVDALFYIELPEYQKNFAADISFSSQSVSMPISLFGATVDLSGYITQYASGLRMFMNIFVSGLAALFVIRAFRVHLNID